MGERTPRQVAFLDVGASYAEIALEIDDAYRRVMASGWFLLGAELETFEDEFAASEGATRAVGVGSGLDALVLTLRAFGVEAGDEVIVPAHTFVATWLAVSAVGATVVPVDVDERIPTFSADAVAAAITPRTAAIIPVHLYGIPAPMGPLRAVADAAGVPLIVDAAQAHGAAYDGRPSTVLADAACWSFYPGKNLGAFGDGGAVTTDDAHVADRIRLLRNYGARTKYVHEEPGVNSRLDELQAAFLRVKLRHLPAWNRRRAAVADRYSSAITGVEVPWIPADRTSSWHLYVIRTGARERLARHCEAHGIGTGVHYPTPPHRQPAYSGKLLGSFPATERWTETALSVPIGPHLDDSDVDRVIDVLGAFDQHAAASAG